MICVQCGKTIRKNSRRAVYLYDRQLPGEEQVEVYVCSQSCLRDFNDYEGYEDADRSQEG